MHSSSSTSTDLTNEKLDDGLFLSVLEKLISETRFLQNKPPLLIPKESRAARHVVDALRPFDGILEIQELCFISGRSNVIIKYPSKSCKRRCFSFVGSHFDVVPACAERWSFDPFSLKIDGDFLLGRGTTDCLGHVALLVNVFTRLALRTPDLGFDVYAVLIADEESGGNSSIPVGVEALYENGYLDTLKMGPVIWLDSADKHPNIGSGGLATWSLKVNGKLFHSGFPHKAVNAFEAANDILLYVQDQFYRKFVRHSREKEYGFQCSSSMKATSCHMDSNSLNQIPGMCEIKGDIRLIPFYQIAEAMQLVEDCISAIQGNPDIVKSSSRGPDSKYNGAIIEWTWLSGEKGVPGLACDLDSPGFKVLREATEEVLGYCSPIADTGTLPLVGDLQRKGFDVQTVGYGLEGILDLFFFTCIDYYHADDERARLSDFQDGFSVIMRMLSKFSEDTLKI